MPALALLPPLDTGGPPDDPRAPAGQLWLPEVRTYWLAVVPPGPGHRQRARRRHFVARQQVRFPFAARLFWGPPVAAALAWYLGPTLPRAAEEAPEAGAPAPLAAPAGPPARRPPRRRRDQTPALGRAVGRAHGMRRNLSAAEAREFEANRRHPVMGRLLRSLPVLRPKTREDCKDGPRPCPWAGCSYHLAYEVRPTSGTLVQNFAGLEIDELAETCALDIADREAFSLEDVGRFMNLTLERVRQVEKVALAKLKAQGVMLGGDAHDLAVLPDDVRDGFAGFKKTPARPTFATGVFSFLPQVRHRE